MSEAQDTQTHNFQTEAKQLLQLMIHSLYSNTEIFLRELISNSSDAIDKLRFKAIEEPELIAGDSDYRIDISFDKDAKTLMVTDNGVAISTEPDEGRGIKDFAAYAEGFGVQHFSCDGSVFWDVYNPTYRVADYVQRVH